MHLYTHAQKHIYINTHIHNTRVIPIKKREETQVIRERIILVTRLHILRCFNRISVLTGRTIQKHIETKRGEITL